MIDLKRKLLIVQIDKKLQNFSTLNDSDVPAMGWIYSIRTALNMTLAQLGKRLNITAQSVKEIEEREQSKSLTLKKLIEVGEGLNLRFVYGFVPKDSSLEKMIEQRALQVAKEIVIRTSQSMSLEDQQNGNERIKDAIINRSEKLRLEMPKFLWD